MNSLFNVSERWVPSRKSVRGKAVRNSNRLPPTTDIRGVRGHAALPVRED